MKQIPLIEKYMTTTPYTIGSSATIEEALKMMKENDIRHLPVQDEEKLVGILTDRDLKLAASFKGQGDLQVKDVMIPEPYYITPDTPLEQVVFEMAEHKYGSAVVQQKNGKIVGIFTAIDSLRVLGEVLQSRFKPQVL